MLCKVESGYTVYWEYENTSSTKPLANISNIDANITLFAKLEYAYANDGQSHTPALDFYKNWENNYCYTRGMPVAAYGDALEIITVNLSENWVSQATSLKIYINNSAHTQTYTYTLTGKIIIYGSYVQPPENYKKTVQTEVKPIWEKTTVILFGILPNGVWRDGN